MKELLRRHGYFWSHRQFLSQVAVGIFFLVVAMGATYYANVYSTIRASNSVTDIILDNLPVVNVGFVFNEGALIFIAFIVGVLFYKPHTIPFILKSVALFFITRSIFVTLTHLAPPIPGLSADTTDLIYKISSGEDLFFSAHTGFPFLMAVIFWENKFLRYVFLLMTLIGGGSVLLGHLHYSIDVFSALFISFGIFHIAKEAFRKDYALFGEDI
ncbi:MAG: hypothetical protein A2122_02925 [Candidatus Liptonbacteria bacterium GWB1_49_6]|uniref:Sphingomyelin synthase-like domain-containing protein n=1 Tax=Candidatus Liptonbacteria bacterium GWB1_49_6 TaxID=1798644 RepID=A0A1G2C7L2_9BACT|nr:MAG: hypothetical protein A2122_02925 [Candidatus Liptonbacteria bacterium GWB1_49_6]